MQPKIRYVKLIFCSIVLASPEHFVGSNSCESQATPISRPLRHDWIQIATDYPREEKPSGSVARMAQRLDIHRSVVKPAAHRAWRHTERTPIFETPRSDAKG